MNGQMDCLIEFCVLSSWRTCVFVPLICCLPCSNRRQREGSEGWAPTRPPKRKRQQQVPRQQAAGDVRPSLKQVAV